MNMSYRHLNNNVNDKIGIRLRIESLKTNNFKCFKVLALHKVRVLNL